MGHTSRVALDRSLHVSFPTEWSHYSERNSMILGGVGSEFETYREGRGEEVWISWCKIQAWRTVICSVSIMGCPGWWHLWSLPASGVFLYVPVWRKGVASAAGAPHYLRAVRAASPCLLGKQVCFHLEFLCLPRTTLDRCVLLHLIPIGSQRRPLRAVQREVVTRFSEPCVM